jgi:hypothetical protein
MKRLLAIAALLSVSILAVLIVFEGSDSFQPKTGSKRMPTQVEGTIEEMLKADQSGDLAVPEPAKEMKIAPVFDVTGAVVSDPTGTMLNANHLDDIVVPVTGADMKIAPVFDNTGAITSDPTGTILGLTKP